MRPKEESVVSGKTEEFFMINGLRFFAAFWVLLYHLGIHFQKLNGLNLLQPFLDQGSLAMALFFMLSGFILSYRYKGFENAEQRCRYFSARIARLYPVYVAMGIFTYWQVSKAPSLIGVIEAGLLILLFLLALQAWFPQLFPVWNFAGSWSLSVETFFYVLFPELRNGIKRASDRTLRLLCYSLPLLMGLIVAGSFLGLATGKGPGLDTYILPIFRLPEFILGMAGYVFFVERGKDLRVLAVLGPALFVVLIGVTYVRDLPGYMDYNFLAALPFLAAFVFGIRASATNWIRLTLNYLGRISYCVYLAQFLTLPSLKYLGEGWSVRELWLGGLISTLGVAIFCYHVIETSAYGWIRATSCRLLLQGSRWLRAKA